MRERWARIANLVLLLIIAVAVVWVAVRIELTFWTFGFAAYSAIDPESVAFDDERDIEGLVVREVVLVEGVGREEPLVALAAGTWRATVEVSDVRIDWAQIAVAGPRRNATGWNLAASPRTIFVVSHSEPSPDTPAMLNGREFIVRVNAIDDHPWSMTLERFGDPMQALIDRETP